MKKLQGKSKEEYIFMGSRASILLDGKSTDGRMSVVELTEFKGLEAPAHIHGNEDELIEVREGQLTFYSNGEEQELFAGDTVHLPKGNAHYFKVHTDSARIRVVSTPAGFETLIRNVGKPVSSETDMPSMETVHQQVGSLIAEGEKLGLKVLIPTK